MPQKKRLIVQYSWYVMDGTLLVLLMVCEFAGWLDAFWGIAVIGVTFLVTDSILLIRYAPLYVGDSKPEEHSPIRCAVPIACARAAVIVAMAGSIAFQAGTLVTALALVYATIMFAGAVLPREVLEHPLLDTVPPGR